MATSHQERFYPYTAVSYSKTSILVDDAVGNYDRHFKVGEDYTNALCEKNRIHLYSSIIFPKAKGLVNREEHFSNQLKKSIKVGLYHMKYYYLIFFLTPLIASCSPTTSLKKSYATIPLAMYSTADGEEDECVTPLENDGVPFVVDMNTGQECFAFSYTDYEGKEIPTSHANFRCYEDRIVYDKYPYSIDCTPADEREPDFGYEVGNACQEAASHGGGVREKLVDYVYPGSEDCSFKHGLP